MKEIVCPHCNTTFQVDESTYAAILAQVRGKEFDKELERRVAEIHEKASAQHLSEKLKAEKDFESRLAAKENKITELEARISNHENLRAADILKVKSERQEEIHGKEMEITQLKAQIEANRHAAQKSEADLRKYFEMQLGNKQEEIDRLKDFKLKLSTKMIGETLEQHCAREFEMAQNAGQYPFATFEKDNKVVDGTKGDFIFRDYVDGVEYISVMFEMKNETDSTSTKHRNEDFLEKLHKDREKKQCEYAVLVSMLEQDNEVYNIGIVDKSYRFPKMIVIRPQFFIPLLRLLTQAARKGYEERRMLLAELETARNETRDFAKFEEKINRFRTSFNNNVVAAHKKFIAATEGIDKAIEGLEKQIKVLRTVKENFEASEQRLLKANEIADEDLTVKKLTHGIPSIRRLIEEG